MTERKEGLERKQAPAKPPEKQPPRDEIEHDPDSEPPRTAKPPGDEPEWRRDEGC